MEYFIISTFVVSNMIVTFLVILVSTVSLFVIYFSGFMVGGLELVSETSSLFVVFGSCGGVVLGNVSITVSVMLTLLAISFFTVIFLMFPWQD